VSDHAVYCGQFGYASVLFATCVFSGLSSSLAIAYERLVQRSDERFLTENLFEIYGELGSIWNIFLVFPMAKKKKCPNHHLGRQLDLSNSTHHTHSLRKEIKSKFSIV